MADKNVVVKVQPRTPTGIKSTIAFQITTEQSIMLILEKECNIQIHWFGKPYANYSFMIQQLISERYSIALNGETVFFDDNIHNLERMCMDLNITGCLVRDTGLAHGKQQES